MKSAAARITIIVVDDHVLFRLGLKQVVLNDARFELLAEAGDGREAFELINARRPQLAVLDVQLPGMSGLDVAAALREAGCPTRLTMLTMLRDEAVFNRAMNAGVLGFLLKENAVEEIVNCLVSVAAGMPYVSPLLSAFLLNRRDRTAALAAHAPSLEDLTMAERRILKRIADKKSTKEIAIELGVSPRTIETHRANIAAKLELKGANSVLQFAIEHRDALASLQ
jgi:DNA-binding NarL/FixJ family response regulator